VEQLILIAVILVFSSLVDAVARKKRQAESGEGPTPASPTGSSQPGRAGARERTPPTYDLDPSFDDAAQAGSRGVPARGSAAGPRAASASSEGLIPADVWEEIQALARGESAPARGTPAPTRTPPPARSPAGGPSPASTAPARGAPRAARAPTSTAERPLPSASVPTKGPIVTPEHAVHLTHPKYGTPVHDRLTGFDDHARPRGLSTQGMAVRSALRGRGAGLRQAVLLQEILGPPVSLKDDPSAG